MDPSPDGTKLVYLARQRDAEQIILLNLKIKGDDHGLAKSENRWAALAAMSTFVAKNIGER